MVQQDWEDTLNKQYLFDPSVFFVMINLISFLIFLIHYNIHLNLI